MGNASDFQSAPEWVMQETLLLTGAVTVILALKERIDKIACDNRDSPSDWRGAIFMSEADRINLKRSCWQIEIGNLGQLETSPSGHHGTDAARSTWRAMTSLWQRRPGLHSAKELLC